MSATATCHCAGRQCTIATGFTPLESRGPETEATEAVTSSRRAEQHALHGEAHGVTAAAPGSRKLDKMPERGANAEGRGPSEIILDCAPEEAFEQSGTILSQVVKVMAMASDDDSPLLFSKLDTTEGVWQMVCKAGQED